MKGNSIVSICLVMGLMLHSSLTRTLPPDMDEREHQFYQECKQSSDCPESYCCVLGMMRYQMPYCMRIGDHQDPCHPYSENYRRNFTLNFPTTEVHVEESWLLMCPCERGLVCSKVTATCTNKDGE